MDGALDMFLVRQDVLRERCLVSTIPSFQKLAADIRWLRLHGTCSPEDVPRLVDLDLEIAGKHVEAQQSARRAVEILNKRYPANPMCRLQASNSHSPVRVCVDAWPHCAKEAHAKWIRRSQIRGLYTKIAGGVITARQRATCAFRGTRHSQKYCRVETRLANRPAQDDAQT